MAKLKFGGVEENVVTREEFPLSRAREVLKDEIIAIIGYGVQGPAQAMNLKDNGMTVIVGQAPEFREDWDRAVSDGFVPGETLFNIEEAAEKATVVQYLVSDAAQRAVWPKLKPCLKEGDALYFSHGFSVTYKE
ncbi:MAG TPA: ketol-acid reductoisomerase, partial [Bacteroides sp.]|nr:ketol-acid reductoisomerase [Bacteroides sp.]